MAMFLEMDRPNLKSGLAEESVVVIDVREPHEFAAGRIPGSISMPLSKFDPTDLPRDQTKKYVFSCAAGIRSLQALMLAAGVGAEIDTHYRGGFKDWAMAGEPIER